VHRVAALRGVVVEVRAAFLTAVMMMISLKTNH
jgi:hypothetical protein